MLKFFKYFILQTAIITIIFSVAGFIYAGLEFFVFDLGMQLGAPCDKIRIIIGAIIISLAVITALVLLLLDKFNLTPKRGKKDAIK